MYVGNGSNNVIDILNGYSNKVTGTISLNGESPWGLAINPINNRLYVTLGTNQVDIINTVKNTILGTVSVGSDDYNVAVNWATGNVFVPDTLFGPSTTGIMDKNGKVLAQVQVGDTPEGVDIDPITNLAFVANSAFNTITVINGVTNSAVRTVGGIPAFFVAVNPVTEKVYVSGGETVTVMTEK